MDRRRTRLKSLPVLLGAAALAACASVENPARSAAEIVALRWLAPGRDAVAFLTSAPAECSATPADPAQALARDRGRAAFESPVLLGGPAGSLGLACASCHSAGRGNADFFMARLSGAPGTADVTSNILSKTREDGVFNPKPIPDIAARDGAQITDRASPDFHAKLRGLIVEEFDGQTPPAPIFEDVRIYLDSLVLSACPASPGARPIRVAQDLAAARVALEAARRGAAEEQLFWLNVARRRLERIDERYQPASLRRERAAIGAMNARLRAIQNAVRTGREAKPVSDRDWAAFATTIEAGEDRSLYDAAALRAALAL